MIRQRISLPLTIPSDAAHLIIPEQYKITYEAWEEQIALSHYFLFVYGISPKELKMVSVGLIISRRLT
ncbi:hypothetical protein HZS_3482 [Henneguya salminicola]|nr:hypothetical protein HZS_3482 [Henneguya salminicola]